MKVSSFFAALTLASLLVGGRLNAQSGAKVLTPPKPADTAARPQTTKPSAANTTTVPAQPAAAATVSVPQSAVLDAIREAVFHNLLERDRAGFNTIASAFCLALSNDDFKKVPVTMDRADPAEGMVRRLASPRLPTRRASTCAFQPNAAGRSVVGRALLYTVGAIDVSEDRAEAAAAFNYDGYSAGGFTFSLERSDSGWVVKQWRQEWTAKPNGS